VRAGTYADRQFPYVPGRDFSGVVAVLGAGVTDLEVGDPVFGVVEQAADGCYGRERSRSARLSWRASRQPQPRRRRRPALIGLTALVSVEDTLK